MQIVVMQSQRTWSVPIYSSKKRHFDRSCSQSHREQRSGEIRFSTSDMSQPSPCFAFVFAFVRLSVSSHHAIAVIIHHESPTEKQLPVHFRTPITNSGQPATCLHNTIIQKPTKIKHSQIFPVATKMLKQS
jgi:hypothetical protein